MKIEDIKRVLIIGSGTMGQQIGFVCAMHGYETVLYDIERTMLDTALKRIQQLASQFVSSGKITQKDADDIMARVDLSDDPAKAAIDVDFVSECIPEDPELKGKVFAQFDKLCPERTIFTTNTSSLLPSMFAEKTGRPKQFAALHFHDVRISKVVDIMPHPGTSRETIDIIHGFAKSIGQTPIMLHKENNGYVFNSMLSSLFMSALTLAARNVASIEDIDRSWMGVMHAPMGPFGIMDQVGLKTVYTITDYWANTAKNKQGRINAAFLKPYVEKGHLGVKAGQGFYSYPDPVYAHPGFLEGDKKP
ncbi:MAG: 3-hydroxyacyl-CoA dehydrogenase [Thermodesulfobacteriota bacterium]|nr:3-hydroxyacyl-CoA dehydrogenase [Thermodesulfobacteriota bacterium]